MVLVHFSLIFDLSTNMVVPFNKIPLFSKGLISFTISFVSLFASVIPEPPNNDLALAANTDVGTTSFIRLFASPRNPSDCTIFDS